MCVVTRAWLIERNGYEARQTSKMPRFILHNLLFFAHTLCTSYVIKTFLLASSLVSSKQPSCFVHGQGQEREH